MYNFNHLEISNHPLHQIEYSIIDSCNKNCKACSHFAPLAARPNLLGLEEFARNIEILHQIVPDVHTFWLIGGEPTLHPNYLELLKKLRAIYDDIPVGIMSNGYGVLLRQNDKRFRDFIKDNQIVWRITTYNVSPKVYIDLFEKNSCVDLLSLDINNQFSNLVVLSDKSQEKTEAKYQKCGWERLNIFVRDGKIWKCPSVEYIDLFNQYFHKNFKIAFDDFLEINDKLTREKLIEFKNCPSSFCRNCDLSKRFSKIFTVEKSKKSISEWLAD